MSYDKTSLTPEEKNQNQQQRKHTRLQLQVDVRGAFAVGGSECVLSVHLRLGAVKQQHDVAVEIAFLQRTRTQVSKQLCKAVTCSS